MSWDDPICGDIHDDLTSIVCERPVGHTGEHEGYSIVTWPRVDEPEAKAS